jgi:hypothetical protein
VWALDTDTAGRGRSVTLIARRRGGGGHVARGRLHPRRAGPVPARGVDGRGGGQIAAGAHRIGGREGRGGGGEGGGEGRALRRRRRGAPVVAGVGQHRAWARAVAVAVRMGKVARGLGREDDGVWRTMVARCVRLLVEVETWRGPASRRGASRWARNGS